MLFSGSLVLSASVGANALMFRGRAIDKGRTAVSAPLALGVTVQFSHRCGIFICGFLCGIQVTILILFAWLIFQ